MLRSPLVLVLGPPLLGLALAAGARGQDDVRPRPGLPDSTPEVPPEESGVMDDLGESFDEALDRLEALESWIVLREETAPAPRLVRAAAGVIVFLDVQSETQSDRGTVLDNLEQEQGLPGSGPAAWLDISIGGSVRGGFDAMYFARRGELSRQTSEVRFDNQTIAGPGDVAACDLSVFTCSGYVEWNPLHGSTYRLGVLGGLRYFDVNVELRGVRNDLNRPETHGRERGELVSPYFGGHVELTPFPALSVSAHVQFMNWSWSAAGLKEARYLEFGLGAMVYVVPGRLGLGAEMRYFFAQAETRLDDDDGQQLEVGASATGVAFTVLFQY